MKTRSSPVKKAAPMAVDRPSALTPDQNPPQMVLLPKHDESQCRVLELENPSSGELNKYFFDPKTGIYEFKKVSPPPGSLRSILSVYNPQPLSAFPRENNAAAPQPEGGFINKSASALVATPIDPLWLILPILYPPNVQGKGETTKRMFQPFDDLIDAVPNLSSDFRFLLYNESFRDMLSPKMDMICDTVEAGDEKMFRISEEKLVNRIIIIGKTLSATPLPSSMEENFIRRPLEVPLVAVKRENTTISVAAEAGESQSAFDSQISASTSADEGENVSASTTISTPATELSSFTSSTTTTTVTETLVAEASDEVIQLQRIRTVVSFILASYFPSHISSIVNSHLSLPTSPINFEPLNLRLKEIAALHADAVESRALGDFSRKRAVDNEVATETRAEKKLKLEEEEKKKKMGESKGVRDLKKVNTKGMKKMSEFFTKAGPKPKT